jgi:hypothetical protein
MNGATPQREKVEFPTNQPVLLRLDYDEGKLTAGRFGDQIQRTFDGGKKIAWLDIDVDTLILESGAKAGDEIAIQKREAKGPGGRKKVSWEVERVQEEPEPPPAPAARDARPTAAPLPQRAPVSAPRPTPRPVNEDRKQLPIDNSRVEATLHEARTFADCLASAAHACLLFNVEAKEQGRDEAWDKADIRTIAITLFIQRGGAKK